MADVCIVGLGRLGSPLAAVLAAAGHTVHGVDPFSPGAVDAINDGRAPVSETGLDDLIASLPEGQLTASTSYADGPRHADMTFVVVPTPSDANGRFDPSAVLDACQQTVRHVDPARDPHTLVVCSTVMPGTMEAHVVPLVADEAARRSVEVTVSYSPEFVALGSVIHDMHWPDLVLIGADDPSTHDRVARVLATVSGGHFPHVACLSLIDAEIAKIALNSALVTKISLANTIAEVCEATPGADARAVLDTLGHDSRIGPKFLRAGASAGGPCLQRDSVAMASFLRCAGVLPWLAEATQSVNDHQVVRAARRLASYSRVAILGLAYKPGTSVYEQSFGLRVAEALIAAGVTVVCHAPLARPHGLTLAGGAQEAVDQVDAVLVATAWPEYATVDVGGRFTIDTWGVLRPQSGVIVTGRSTG